MGIHRSGQLQFLMLQENCSFSVIFRHPHLFQKTVDFIAPTPDIALVWSTVVNHLVTTRKKDFANFNEDAWLQVIALISAKNPGIK